MLFVVAPPHVYTKSPDGMQFGRARRRACLFGNSIGINRDGEGDLTYTIKEDIRGIGAKNLSEKIYL